MNLLGNTILDGWYYATDNNMRLCITVKMDISEKQSRKEIIHRRSLTSIVDIDITNLNT